MLKQVKNYFLVTALLLTLFLPGLGQAQNDDAMVTAIMGMRAEIESLYTQIDQNTDNYKAQMKSLALQIADAEAQINRKKTSIKLAEIDLEKINTKLSSSASGSIDLFPLLNEGFTLQEKTIKSGVPFKVEERMAAVEKIRNDLQAERITPERALAQLWASYGDNLRMTKEIGLFKQKISLGGQDTQAEIAKLGTVMLFFAAPDNRVGYVTQDGSAYTYQIVTDPKVRDQIVLLFDSLNKQIRTGLFTLPNALLLQGGKS